MDNQIDSAVKVGRRYWFVDGFTEMLGGGLFVLLGGFLLLRGLAPEGSFLAQFASLAGDVGFIKIIGFLAVGLALWWLKDRFTYPRSGYIREKRIPRRQVLVFLRNFFLCMLLIVLALAAGFFFVPSLRASVFSMPVWLPLLVSVLWAVLCMLAGRWMGLRRFTVLGLLILLAGIGISAWQLGVGLPPLPAEALQSSPLAALPEALRAPLVESISRTFAGIGLLTLVTGVFFIVSGLVTFLRYRKENPAPYEEEA
jgi:hypothetical protein